MAGARRGEAPGHLICGAVLASASRSGARPARG